MRLERLWCKQSDWGWRRWCARAGGTLIDSDNKQNTKLLGYARLGWYCVLKVEEGGRGGRRGRMKMERREEEDENGKRETRLGEDNVYYKRVFDKAKRHKRGE